MTIPELRETRGHGLEREIGGVAVLDLFPRQRCGDARVGPGPHRIGAGDRPVLRILVVVEEHAVALLLPPFARRELRRTAFHLARKGERRASHDAEGPALLNPYVDVNAARAGGFRP